MPKSYNKTILTLSIFLKLSLLNAQNILNDKECGLNELRYTTGAYNQPTTSEGITKALGNDYKNETESGSKLLNYTSKGIKFYLNDNNLSDIEVVPELFQGKTQSGLILGKTTTLAQVKEIYNIETARFKFFDEQYIEISLKGGRGGIYICPINFCIKKTAELEKMKDMAPEKLTAYFFNSTEGLQLKVDKIRLVQSVEMGFGF